MTFRKMAKGEQVAPGEKWVTVTTGLSGHFAVVMWINNEDQQDVMGPFPEPFDTGLGRYAHRDEAKDEALLIAEDFDLPYYFGEDA